MNGESEIEIRRIYEAEDFGDALPDDVRAAEERMRDTSAARAPGSGAKS